MRFIDNLSSGYIACGFSAKVKISLMCVCISTGVCSAYVLCACQEHGVDEAKKALVALVLLLYFMVV